MKSQEERWLLSEKYQGVKSEAFYADCKALALGEPLAYLIGSVPFLDCTITLDNHPLIPRVETEFWVEQAIEAIKESQHNQSSLFGNLTGINPDSDTPLLPQPNPPSNSRVATRLDARQITPNNNVQSTSKILALGKTELDQPDLAKDRLSPGGFGWGGEGVNESGSVGLVPSRILDLCAGSGCIGVAVAKAIPDSHVDFGEIDARLLTTIDTNCKTNGITPDRYHIYHSNLLTAIPAENKYDFIVSNPPYIDPAIDRAEESVKTHEPHLALYGGPQGMEIIEQLIKTAPSHLTPGGQLWIEHEPEQVGAISAAAAEHNFACVTYPDQYEVLRYSVLVLQ